MFEKYSLPAALLMKLLAASNPKIVIIKNLLSAKSTISNNIYILSLAMSLCNFLGIKIEDKQYTKKLILTTALLHFLGSSLWINNNDQGNKSLKNYVIPSFNQVEKLILNKSKL